jgi:predicted porin
MIKQFATVAVLAMSSPAIAEEASGLSFSGEVDSQYNVNTEVLDITLTPKASYWLGGATELSVGTDLTVWNNNTEFMLLDHTDTLPTLDFKAEHMMDSNWKVYGEVSYNLETETRSDITVGASFSF